MQFFCDMTTTFCVFVSLMFFMSHDVLFAIHWRLSSFVASSSSLLKIQLFPDMSNEQGAYYLYANV